MEYETTRFFSWSFIFALLDFFPVLCYDNANAMKKG